MARLVLGPLLRYTGSTQATIWVETDGACDVSVLGAHRRTFAVEGHHYALVCSRISSGDRCRPYKVELDGEQVWPLDDGRPPSTIHTREHERQARLMFGSCRVGDPERAPYTLPPAEHPQGFGVDALWALSRRLQAGGRSGPTACCCSATRCTPTRSRPRRARSCAAGATSRSRRAEVADFEEYTRLYREAWSDPDIRWLLATVPSTMIFDDHDVRDDWNISEAWVREIRATDWWDARISGAFMAYWLYQHLGNLVAARAGRGARCSPRSARRDDGGPAPATSSRASRIARRRRAASPTTATSDARDWS